MANLIQIKRSLTTATPTSLANGELAYTANGDVLFIGSNGAVVPIGGKRVPGTLTANQALVANSTSGIDKIITSNAVISTLWANGSSGTTGQVLVSNGTNVYWGTGTSGSNTYVQFNDSGVANGVAGFTFDKTSNTLAVSNAVQTQYIIAPNGSRNITTNYNSVSGGVGIATDLTVGASGSGGNVSVPSTATINIGTTTVNSTVYTGTANNASYLGGNTASDLRTYTDQKAGNAYSNATSYADTKAATAYSNATSYAATIAGTAYSNAVSYADNKAANAYSNAMSDTLSRNGTYTGNNIFQGTNTVISSNVIFSNYISSNAIPSVNNSFHLGNNSLRWAQVHVANVHAVTGYFDGSVQVSGDLVVTGNLTTTNVNSVVVSDPMIYLAGNNYSGDLLDIGFAANYNNGSANLHTGLFRDASDSGIWKLFQGSEQELSGNNVVNTAANGFTLAILQSYLQSGALISNATSVYITANSTVNVNIVANTLTLSSPLSGTSGGTGLASYTAEDILVANSSNGFRKLGLGTSGYVLQSNGSALVYDTLDGGTF